MQQTHRILVIDDDGLTRELLSRTLGRYGYEVVQSADGSHALGLVEQERPALVVSDYEMPGFTGADFCRRVRNHADFEIASLPIILLTAHTGEEHEVECLEAGANDFVSKPVNAQVLRARIETQIRLHDLQAEMRRQTAELQAWRDTHERDLEAAQITQQAILPARPPILPGWDVAAEYRPVIHVGGDIYDWTRLSTWEWLFWVADATGHGASAALMTTLTKLVFRHATSEAALPSEILAAVNADVFGALRGKSFMTAACCSLEPETGRLRFSGSGHPPLIIRRADGRTEMLASQSPPVGILARHQVSDTDAVLEPGDVALLYTDGLYSGLGRDVAQRTPDSLLEELPQPRGTAADFLRDLMGNLSRGMEKPLFPDDIAAIAILRKG